MKRLDRKHPLAIRWFHWVNFPILFGMIYTGLLIYWANDEYRIGWGSFTLFHFFPDWFYNVLGLGRSLARGMAWHFFLMWIFVINGILYVLYTLISGEWRYLAPDRNSFREGLAVMLHDLGLGPEPVLSSKYNGAQRIAYSAIVLMGVGSLVTGIAIYKYVQFAWLAKLLGGYKAARLEHFLLTLGYLAFFVIHIAQVIRAGWGNFASMVMGYEVSDTRRSNAGRVKA